MPAACADCSANARSYATAAGAPVIAGRGGELPAPVGAVEVGRGEDLEVAPQVADLVAGAADAAAAREHAAVGQQQRGRVVLAGDRGRGELGPGAGRRVPALRLVGRVGEVDEPTAAVRRLAARGKDAPVGQHRQVVLAAAPVHRAGQRAQRRAGARARRSWRSGSARSAGRPRSRCRRLPRGSGRCRRARSCRRSGRACRGRRTTRGRRARPCRPPPARARGRAAARARPVRPGGTGTRGWRASRRRSGGAARRSSSGSRPRSARRR